MQIFGLSLNVSYFVIGAGLGLATAVIGATVDWLRTRHLPESGRRDLPGCMLLTAGGLGSLGVFMIGLTWLLTGSPRAAVIAGGGVIAGFFTAFSFISILWLLQDRFK